MSFKRLCLDFPRIIGDRARNVIVPSMDQVLPSKVGTVNR